MMRLSEFQQGKLGQYSLKIDWDRAKNAKIGSVGGTLGMFIGFSFLKKYSFC